MHACHDMAGVFIQIHRMGVPSMSVYKRIIWSLYYRRRAYSATMIIVARIKAIMIISPDSPGPMAIHGFVLMVDARCIIEELFIKS